MSDILNSSSVLEVLRPVQDPELRKSLVELNMIRNVKIEDGKVSFTLVLTTPACPLREFIVEDCQRAVKKLPGVTDVLVDVTAQTPHQKGMSDRTGIAGVKNIVAISSGKGGVGKSTVAVNVAVALAQSGAKVGLLDADIYGPNAPTMLGLAEAQIIVRQGKQGEELEPAFNHGVKLVSMGFLIDRDQPPVSLSGAVGRTRLSDCRYAPRNGRCPADSNSSSADGGCGDCYHAANRGAVGFP